MQPRLLCHIRRFQSSRINLKPRLELLPTPYALFDPSLLKTSPEVEPLDVRGRDLFAKVVNYKYKADSFNLWRKLPAELRQLFDDPPEEVGYHLARIERGRKIAHCSTNEDNPYYHSGLYPWEIVKDKLRRPSDFSYDKYDQLIDETFRLRLKDLNYENIRAAFAGLSDSSSDLPTKHTLECFRQQKIQYVQGLKKEGLKNRERTNPEAVATTSYNAFLVEMMAQLPSSLSLAERNQIASQRWAELPLDAKFRKYGRNYPHRLRSHRENVLDIKTDQVMDYIFGVLNTLPEWRNWRAARYGSFRYLDGIAFPVLVEKRYNAVLLV